MYLRQTNARFLALLAACIAPAALAYVPCPDCRVQCGEFVSSQAAKLEAATSELAVRTRSAANVFATESSQDKSRRVGIEKAHDAHVKAYAMHRSASFISDLIDLRDGTTEPATRRRLQEVIHQQARTLHRDAVTVADLISATEPFRGASWWSYLESAAKLNSAVLSFVEKCN